MRIVGIGGNGASSPTFSHVGAAFDLGEPRYPSNHLDSILHGRHYVIFGGSQLAGAQHGSFGTTTLTVPAGVKYIRDGVTLSGVGEPGGEDYALEHGIEAGFMEALKEAGKIEGSTVLCRYNSATPTKDWVDTHFATVVTDVNNAGITPNVVMFIIAGQDSLTNATMSDCYINVPKLISLVNTNWPGAAFICMGIVAEDPGFATAPQTRLIGQLRFEDALDGRRAWIPHDEEIIELQVEDNTHPTAAGTEVMGRLYAGRVLDAGIPG